MYRLLAEWILGEPVENYESEYMTRGHDLEDAAVSAYEFLTDTETQPAGFVTTDDGLIGASPDRFVGSDRLLEIKCPLAQTQVDYLLNGTLEAGYRCQLQGQLYVTERSGVDIFAYHPKLPARLMKVERDEQFIKSLALALRTFVDVMLLKRADLQRTYDVKPPDKRVPPGSRPFPLRIEAIIASLFPR